MSFTGAKFGRIALVTVETAPDATGNSRFLTIPPSGQPSDDLSIEFSVNRQSFASTQTAQIRIYNLQPGTRDAIYKDYFDWTQFRAIQLRAGYGNFAPVIFNGTVLQAYSEKENEDTVTIIDCFDGGFPMTNGWTNVTNAGGSAGKSGTQVINELAAAMPGLKGPAVVGSFPVTNLRGEVLFGNTWGLIQLKSGKQATISDGIVYALQPQEGLLNGTITDITTLTSPNAEIPVISAETGLLGAPRRSGIMVEWDMLLEPRLTLFQIVDLQSEFNKQWNGPHKVMGIRHRAMVSKSQGGEAVTTARMLFGKGLAFEDAVLGQYAP